MSSDSSSSSAPGPHPELAPAAHGHATIPERSLLAGFGVGLGRLVAALANIVKLAVLVVLLFVLVNVVSLFTRAPAETPPKEVFYSGERAAQDKIAIIHIDGVLMEGLNGFAMRQIDTAAADPDVKAVVVRINSPGGTITASDDLRERLNALRRGSNRRHPGAPKPVVVSMSSIAASGGYYIAMIKSEPPTPLFAEPTTITGSIGVYAAFPNVKEFADKNGVKLSFLKAGDIKASGSPFHDMTDHEKEVWQSSVDHAYLRFLEVVEETRSPMLTRDILQEDVKIQETLPIRSGPDRVKRLDSKRYRADGGIYTAAQALRFKLIDKIGYLDDAVAEARRLADLQDYKAIAYTRPATLLGLLTGAEGGKPPLLLDAERLGTAAAPRLWFLAPQHDMAGYLSALGR